MGKEYGQQYTVKDNTNISFVIDFVGGNQASFVSQKEKKNQNHASALKSKIDKSYSILFKLVRNLKSLIIPILKKILISGLKKSIRQKYLEKIFRMLS